MKRRGLGEVGRVKGYGEEKEVRGGEGEACAPIHQKSWLCH